MGGEEIERLIKFKFLGMAVSEDEEEETPAIEANLKKARMKWVM